jgi:nucleotide-binding universal stress UspA family protein
MGPASSRAFLKGPVMQFQPWQRILAPTDFSGFAEAAVEYAHGLAERLGAELHVLHVGRSLDAVVAEHGAQGTVGPLDTEDDYGRWLASLLGERGTVRRVEAVRVGPDAAQAIAHYAEKNTIDLIVMASHGRSGLAHLLMGSVAENVLRSAACPVLVIRPKDGVTAK